MDDVIGRPPHSQILVMPLSSLSSLNTVVQSAFPWWIQRRLPWTWLLSKDFFQICTLLVHLQSRPTSSCQVEVWDPHRRNVHDVKYYPVDCVHVDWFLRGIPTAPKASDQPYCTVMVSLCVTCIRQTFKSLTCEVNDLKRELVWYYRTCVSHSIV